MAVANKAEFLSKLLDDDEDDIVRFEFEHATKKIKCNISLLMQESQVFKIMFSEKWKKETIQLKDFVQFNQYLVFKKFVNILYGIIEVNSLTIQLATDVFFYSHKYEVKVMSDKILLFLKEQMKQRSLSLTEMSRICSFSEMFQLDLKECLDQVKLCLNNENVYEIYLLAERLNLTKVKERALDFSATIKAREIWSAKFLCAVIGSLQQKQQLHEEQIKNLALVKQEKGNKNRGTQQLRPRLFQQPREYEEYVPLSVPTPSLLEPSDDEYDPSQVYGW